MSYWNVVRGDGDSVVVQAETDEKAKRMAYPGLPRDASEAHRIGRQHEMLAKILVQHHANNNPPLNRGGLLA